MAIPEAQLETWSHQGSIVQSSSTYGSIKAALEAGATPYSGKNYRVFLQGSYGNDTNIYAESDVDIVICLDDCFHSDLADLSPPEKEAYSQAYSDATYTFTNFKNDVLGVLQRAYGADVTAGKKAIAVAANGARRKADVVPAVQYRRYSKFRSALDQSYVEGICFFTSDGTQIANYPKQHSANLTSRHQRTSNRLKPLVRSIKNLRGRLVADGRISSRTAPSYFLEGLLYNVPDRCFSPSLQQSFVNAINWLQGEADTSKLVCANEQYYLLWDGTPTSWAPGDYRGFLQAMIALWNDW